MDDQIRVLHVEDDPDFADLTAQYLDQLHGEIESTPVSSGEDAIEHLNNHQPDCVISDFDMPGINGVELLEHVREHHDELPFILFTGKGSEEIASEAISAGVTDYLQKEAGTEQFGLLSNRVDNAVAKHRGQTNFRTLFEELHIGVAILEPETAEITTVNEAFAELFDLEVSALEGELFSDTRLTGSISGHDVTTFVTRAASAGPLTIEWQVTRPDEVDLWTEVHLRPTTIDQRDRVLAFVQDITERKDHERAITELHGVAADLAACETRDDIYRETIDAAKRLFEFDSVAIAEARGDRLAVVAMSENMPLDEPPTMGIDEGIAGRTYQTSSSFLIDDVNQDDRAAPQAEFGSAISVPIGAHGILQVIDDSPAVFSQRDLELAELLVRHTESGLDLLEREHRLERQNERLEEFVSFVSHDLRGPLSVAAGRVNLARAEEDMTHLETAENALDRMDGLIDALLSLSKSEGDLGRTGPVDIGQLAQTCWEELPFEEASLDIEGSITVEGSRSQLRQLIDNLLRNAIEHGGDDVTVTVSQRHEGDGFFLADDGPGLVDDHQRIFERGYTTGPSGIGYGLTIVERIAEAHGWEITAGASEDGGARFDIIGAQLIDTD